MKTFTVHGARTVRLVDAKSEGIIDGGNVGQVWQGRTAQCTEEHDDLSIISY